MVGIMKLISILEREGIVLPGFAEAADAAINEQSGGFIGSLLAGLAAPLLGDLVGGLFGGKGLRRAGNGLRRAGAKN